MGMSLPLVSSFKRKKKKKKMMRRVRRRKGFVIPLDLQIEIPLDIQIEILARLPAKSLMRFKCVSKLWSFLIRSRYLSKLYLTVARPPRLFMSLVDRHRGPAEVYRNPEKSLLLSSSSSSSSNSFNKDLMKMPGIGGDYMATLRGFILYIVGGKACIFNPSTTQIITLPAVESKVAREEETRRYIFYFLGHDPVLDQYKVVCNRTICSKDGGLIIESGYWVYLLEAGGSWKRIEFDQPLLPTTLGVCINGVLYCLGSHLRSRDLIFSFDVRHERFDRIQVPQEVTEFGEFIGFIEYAGKPAIFDHTHLQETGLVELWVLESGGTWSKKSLVLRRSQMRLVQDGWFEGLIVAGTTQDDEVILVLKRVLSAGYILYYDLQRNHLRKVNIGRACHKLRRVCDRELSNPKCIYLNLMDKCESIIHLET